MRHYKKSLIYLLCLAALAQRSQAAAIDPVNTTPTTDYSAIWLRNVFDLKPMTVEKSPDNLDEKPTPPGELKLTGLIELSHVKRALLLLKKRPEPGKPMGNPDASYILAEGEKRDSLEVISIDFIGRSAKVKLNGVISTLSLESGSSSGGTSAHAGYSQRAAANPAAAAYGNSTAAETSVSRMMRPPSTISYGSAPQLINQGGYVGGYNGTSTPGNTTSGSAAGNSTSTPHSSYVQPSVPSDVTAVLLAAQQAAAQVPNRTYPSAPPVNVTIPDPDQSQAAQPTDPAPPGPPTGAPAGLPTGAKVTGSFTAPSATSAP